MSEEKKNSVLKKGSRLRQVHVEGMTMEGFCLARVEGKVMFLRGGAPGDIVDAVVTKVKKKLLEGLVVEVTKPSVYRKEPFCDHFELCGGCTWQHVDYIVQLRSKQQFVQDSFERIGGIWPLKVQPIIPCTKLRYYRNRLDFTFGSSRWLSQEEKNAGKEPEPGLGFHRSRRFDKIVDIHTCYLQSDVSNVIRRMVKKVALEAGMPFFNLKTQTGFLRTLTIRTALSGNVMVVLQVAHECMEWVDLILRKLADNVPKITSIHYVVNTKPNDTFYDQKVITWRGDSYLTDSVYNLINRKKIQFRIGPKSFYQTNSQQASRLYTTTLSIAFLMGKELVYDLYTGVGTIANFIAPHVEKVVGVELVEDAVAEARANARINGIENAYFFSGDVKTMLDDDFLEFHGRPDVVITNPPRAGMHEQVIRTLIKIAPKRIVYVSCNPATQARDISMLSKRFEVGAIQPIDMFPHTNHVETVVGLLLY